MHKPRWWLFASLFALVFVLVVLTAPALATVGHTYEAEIPGPSLGEPFQQPWGLAVDSAGDLYVADAEAQQVDIFSSANVFAPPAIDDTSVGADPFTGPYVRSVAVDTPAGPTQGDVYVAESNGELIDLFKPEGAGKYKLVAERKFGGYMYVAVDNSSGPSKGRVYVLAENTVLAIEPNAAGELEEPGTELPVGGLGSNDGLAVSPVTGDLYVAEPEHHSVAVFNDNGEPDEAPAPKGSEVPGGFGTPTTVAVDATNGEVYVTDEAKKTVDEFSKEGTYLGQITGTAPAMPFTAPPLGVAINSTGHVYISDGIAVDEFGPDEELPPAIEESSVADVTANSATLHATLDPSGPVTTYTFEYAAAGGTFTPVLEPGGTGTVDEGAGKAHLTVTLEGLTPASGYQFRLLTTNHAGSVTGETLSFTTQHIGAFSLPDDRGWELVSPPNKHGADLDSVSEAQATPSGDAIAYEATGPTESDPAADGAYTRVLSSRTPVGWQSHDLNPPNASATLQYQPYQGLSEDLSRGVVETTGVFSPLSPEASERTPYLSTTFSGMASTSWCGEDCYRPLVTGAPGFANVPPGVSFGEEAHCAAPEEPAGCGPQWVGASPDFSHLVLASSAALTPGAPAGESHPRGEAGSLYEWYEGHLSLVSVLPDGDPATPGYERLALGQRTSGFDYRTARAVSGDGSRVVWSEGRSGVGERHLYLRYNATQPQSAVNGSGDCTEPTKACTVQLDQVKGGSGEGAVEARFETASVDDSKIFFIDEQRLTPNSGAGSHAPDLYECELVTAPSGELECKLVDLTPETPSGSAGVGPGVIGASEDGSSVYFVADGLLTGSEENAEHESAQPGDCQAKYSREGDFTCNLYREHDGALTFIAVLSERDDEELAPFTGELGQIAARVSPDGDWLAFMSDRPLTGYDNRDAVSGEPDQEVYLYHAGGGLVCASCNPTGARPHGIAPRPLRLVALEDGAGPWAASLPTWHDPKGNYQTRFLSNSGRVFFDSVDALVPQDTNGTQDVYEYEPPAVGTCTASSTTYSSASNGCISLISSGTSAQESAFLDASESGDDVFFLTTAALSSRDIDTSYDVYDARVGGGEAASTPPAACEGDACQSPGQPPNDPTPDSLTFSGPGNLTSTLPVHSTVKKTAAQIRAERLAKALRACKKFKAKKRRARCDTSAHKRYGPVKRAKKTSARKATNDRRNRS